MITRFQPAAAETEKGDTAMTMSLAGIVLGILNAAIVVAILLLVGAVILWFATWMGFPVPANVQKGYIAVVALIGLYLIVALLFGIPTIRIFTVTELLVLRSLA